ncbi:MAG: SGNH/GDSL hydrolase family protein, partial [Bacteroidota bacterium]
GNGGIDDIIFTATNARYVRMYGTQRGTSWGYSLWEFQVFGALSLPISYNFTSPDVSAWSVVDDSQIASSWQVTGGAYQQGTDVGDLSFGTPYDQSYKKGTYSYLPALAGLSNYRVSVDITPLRDIASRDAFDGQDVGVMFRYRDNNNYYRVSFSARESYARLEKKVGGVFSTLATNARGYTEAQTFHVTVNLRNLGVNRELIQVLVDGDPVFGVIDSGPGLSSGTIALFSMDAVKFDNVTIDVSNPNPSVTVSTPLAYLVQVGGTVSAAAVADNIPSGGSVDFQLASIACAAATQVSPGLFTASCGSPGKGDYYLPGQGLVATLRNSSGGSVATDENQRIGVLGDYYVTIGDSITMGTYDFFSADNQSQDGRVIGQQGFQAGLSDLLTVSDSSPTIVFNDGVGGDKTTDTLTRIDSILARHPGSNRFLMMLGTNDSGGGTPLSQASYKANMQSLANTITGQGKTVWVAKVPPVLPFAANQTRNSDIAGYNTAIDSLTGVQPGPDFYHFFYVDNGTTTLSDDNDRFSLYYDKLHPNALGLRIMGQMWNNVLSGATAAPFFLDRLCNRLVSADCSAVLATNHKQNLLAVGYPYYVDQAYTLSSVPAAIASGVWVSTANAEKNTSGANYIDFRVDRPVTVYVAYDAGAGSLPNWLNPAVSGFADTLLEIQTTDPLSPRLHLYSKVFPAGTVSLGGNLAAGAVGADSNYVVIVTE